ncbi:MAG: LPXTG cell wall anchor domain-containing protein [Rubrobacteraceae bacterium]
MSVLPDTGGPLLPLVGLGAIALGATGLLARNRYSRR